MKVGDRVTSKVHIGTYLVNAGDTGTIIDVCDGLDHLSGYVMCKWDKDGHTDLGWWIADKPVVRPHDGEQYLNVVHNLEIEISVPDTREYLEAITGLAV